MAKYDTDEIGKPGRPPKVRAFPWRLWMFAIAMTAGAVAGGYYTWQYRHESRTAADERDVCKVAAAKQKPALDDMTKKLADCQITVGDYAKKAKDGVAPVAPAVTPPVAPPVTAAATPPVAAPAVVAPAVVAPAVVAPAVIAAPAAGKWLVPVDEIQKQLARMGETGQLQMSARRGSFAMALPTTAMFAAGSAELLKPGELAVLEVGLTLKRYPERRFLVTGHTDESPAKGSAAKDSWELSLARGLTVTRALIQAGVDPKSLVAAGAADSDPVTKEAKDPKNRRVEITLLPAAGELPSLPVSLGADTFKPELKVEAPLPAPKPDAAKPAKP